MSVQTTLQEREIGSRVLAGDNMRGVERIVEPDDFTASVFQKIHSIVGDDAGVEPKSPEIKHITVEEAIRELLQLERASEVHLLTASQ